MTPTPGPAPAPAPTVAVAAAGVPARTLADRLLRPTFPELWTFLAIGLPALAALIATLPTVDLAYQLRAGAEILAGRGIPTSDAWTFTAAGRPWLDQAWGAQAILAAIYAAGGWTGLAVFRAALVAMAFALVLLAVRRRAPWIGGRTAAWLTLAAFVVSAPALALRPQLLGVVCFAEALVLLAGRRRRPGLMLLLPFVAVEWANIHGSFVLAPVLAGLAWLEDLHERSPRAGRTLVLAVTTGAATLVTPFGLEAWRYAAGLATNREVTARITEWQPTSPADVPGILFWASVVLVGVAVVAVARRGRTVPWPALLALAGFAVLGAVAARGIAWWPLMAVVTMAGLATPAPTRAAGAAVAPGTSATPAPAPDAAGPPATASTAATSGGPATPPEPAAEPRRAPRGSPLSAVVGAALVLAGVAFLPAWRAADPGTGAPSGLLAFAPPGVTAALRDVAAPADRVWNPQAWGSWFEFAVPAPAYALDSRIEVIPPETWRDADVVSAAGPGWDRILGDAGVTIVVLDSGGSASPLTDALAASGGWSLGHSDADGQVWVRVPRG